MTIARMLSVPWELFLGRFRIENASRQCFSRRMAP